MSEKYIVGRLFDQTDLILFDELEAAVMVRDQSNQNRLPRSMENQVFRITCVDAPATLPSPTEKELATRLLLLLPGGGLSPDYYSQQEIEQDNAKRKRHT